MAAWLIPALKAILPHVGTIVTAATPVFTKRTAHAANQAALLQQQIAELQSAVSQNAANIKELAEQLGSTVSALEQAAVVAEARLRRAVWFSAIAALLSVVAAGTVLVIGAR